ncbi:hypothetical protein D3C78_1662040 [compost metagenome]
MNRRLNLQVTHAAEKFRHAQDGAAAIPGAVFGKGVMPVFTLGRRLQPQRTFLGDEHIEGRRLADQQGPGAI